MEYWGLPLCEGSSPIDTCLQVGTRVDREQRMAGKLASVASRRHKQERHSPTAGFGFAPHPGAHGGKKSCQYMMPGYFM